VKTFNKKGDAGETSLLFGARVSKDSLCCEAYGTLDEAVSCLGVARNAVRKEKTRSLILRVQQDLFTVGAELATRPEDYQRFTEHFKAVNEDMVGQIEKTINELEAEIKPPENFIIPGLNSGAALLDLSRAIVRRAERRVVTLKIANKVKNEALLHYLNRLADLLFILARFEEN
jgi:cob(I)alamin adenosyltransferase